MPHFMQTLVTGGGGFIGGHLTERLLREGHDVRVLDNFSTGNRANLAAVAGAVDIVEGDIQSYERAANAARGCEVVFHQAALPSVPRSVQDPLTSHGVNSVGTLNLLLAARDAGVRRVVFASSSSVYGANPTLPKQEEMVTAPISPYAVTKLAGEGFCRSFWEVYGLETVALRYFNVFGSRQDPNSQYSAVIPKFITALFEGRSPVIHGDGEQSRDFTFVDNVLDANVLVAGADAAAVAGKRFNCALGDRVTLNTLVHEMIDVIGADVQPEYVEPRPGDVKHSQADITAAREAFGYKPSVSIAEGIRKTIAFYREPAGGR